MGEPLVAVRCFGGLDALNSAYLVRSQLWAAGIDVFLKDEHIVATDPMAWQAFGGVKLLVPESQAAKAEEIINQVESATEVPEV
jgi:hypothetical protein